LEKIWRHIASKLRGISRRLSIRYHARAFLFHNSPKGKLRSKAPQEVCLLQVWSFWTQIRAFRLTVRFIKLVCAFRKWNSAYLGQKISSFDQWEYFSVWRDDLLVKQAEDASWVQRRSFLYIGSQEDTLFDHFYKIYVYRVNKYL
jgi:hypothetical protein